MKDKKETFIKKALDELFKRVGFIDGYDQNFVNSFPLNWYLQMSWTEQEEESYRQWFIESYQKTFKSTKQCAISQAGWFLFSYGWKINLENPSL